MATKPTAKKVVAKKSTKPTGAMPAKPAIGRDIPMKKKYGKNSWNNGMTN